ncbi:MAG TPA: hypothetical protein VGK73_00025 [Polyangiaceae bacterium]
MFFALVLASLVGACGKADIGEACDDVGKEDECVDGAVCTNQDDGAACRRLCDDQDECPAGESCNGVSGTNLKSCQPEG